MKIFFLILITQHILTEECDCLYKNFNPVCGRNGITYYSNCHRKCDNVEKAHDGYCQDQRSICACPLILEPVCGENGVTYNNSCEAQCHGVIVDKVGRCERCQECDKQAYNPICGLNGVTFNNYCELHCHRVPFAYSGACGNKPTCSECNNDWEDSICDVFGNKYKNACYLRCNDATVDPYYKCIQNETLVFTNA